jgi:hypothetical protein
MLQKQSVVVVVELYIVDLSVVLYIVDLSVV